MNYEETYRNFDEEYKKLYAAAQTGMTQDEIIEMAREAGIIHILDEHAHEYGNGTFENTSYPELEAFANLVAAKNKERILQLIKELRPAIKPLEGMGKGKTTSEWFDILVQDIEEKL